MNPRYTLGVMILFIMNMTFSQELVVNVSLKQPKKLVINAGEDISVTAPENIIIGEDITVSGGTPVYSYSWSDGYGNSFDTQIVTVSSFGSYYLTVADANNCSAKDTLQVLNNVYIDPEPASNSLILSPNPSSGSAYVPLESYNGKLRISVVSVSGQEVFNKNINTVPGESFYEIALDNMVEGMYYIIIENRRSRNVYKIILE